MLQNLHNVRAEKYRNVNHLSHLIPIQTKQDLWRQLEENLAKVSVKGTVLFQTLFVL